MADSTPLVKASFSSCLTNKPQNEHDEELIRLQKGCYKNFAYVRNIHAPSVDCKKPVISLLGTFQIQPPPLTH